MSGTIAGQVVDGAGEPVMGASVAVSAGPQPHSDIAALTDNEGRFRLGNLAPGTYTVTAHSPAHPPAEAQVEVVDEQQNSVVIRVDR